MDERAETIQAGRNVDEDFDANVLVHRDAPGPFEGCDDIELAWACHVITLSGFADEQAGNLNEDGLALCAVGRWILRTDVQGFHTLHETASADDAVTLVEGAQVEIDKGKQIADNAIAKEAH